MKELFRSEGGVKLKEAKLNSERNHFGWTPVEGAGRRKKRAFKRPLLSILQSGRHRTWGVAGLTKGMTLRVGVVKIYAGLSSHPTSHPLTALAPVLNDSYLTLLIYGIETLSKTSDSLSSGFLVASMLLVSLGLSFLPSCNLSYVAFDYI